MPRKRKKPADEVVPPVPEPQAIGDVIPRLPIAEKIASLPETDGSPAAEAFKKQREREQASELPPPQTEIITSPERDPVRQLRSWAETVRPHTSYGRGAGVHHVTAKVPVGKDGVRDMVGIKFDRAHKPGPEELKVLKPMLEDAGLKYYLAAESWLKPSRDGAFDETQALAPKLAEARIAWAQDQGRGR